MAKLRPIYKDMSNVKLEDIDVTIKEEERYDVALKMYREDKDILNIYYFSDSAVRDNRFYTYPISRESIEYRYGENALK